MGQQITRLECPIDAMYLIHNALRAEAADLEEMVRRFQIGDSLQFVRLAFVRWAGALMFHAEQEDQYMTRPMSDCASVKDNVKEHAELNEKLEDVFTVFNEEIGETQVIARTQRHLYGAVVALRIAQDDHLESEEAFVLPDVRERFDEFEQLDLVRSLIVDEEGADRRWVMDWMTSRLPSGELQLLADLERRIQTGGAPAR